MGVDLAALKREAEGGEQDRTVVSRIWLAQVHSELLQGRAARAELNALRQGGQA